MTRLYITRSQGDCGKNIDQKDIMLIKSYGNTRCRSSRPEVSVKKLFLEISQNSQENTCASVFIKKETLAQSFMIEHLLL